MLKTKKFIEQNAVWAVLVVMCVGLSFANPAFLTPSNLSNLLTTESIKGILTVGVMFAILSRGIDLSPGSIVALTSVVSASLVQSADYSARILGEGHPYNPVVAVVIALLIGTAFGVANGVLIAYTKIPPFIATLGAMLIVRAVAMLYTNAYPVPQLSDGFRWVATGTLIPGLPNVVLIFIIFAVVAGFMLNYTRFGKNIYAIGGNEQAARVAGINVEKNIILVYTWVAFCASFGGILLAAKAGSGIASAGLNYELDAIAAATVGGTSHSGGIARISGVIAGILILGVISNGLLLLNVSPYNQQIVKGLIIIGAVIFDMRKNAKKK